jgi:hypothetical protein
MLASAGAIYGLTATSAFGYSKLEVTGAHITAQADVRDRLALTEGENLFNLSTQPLVGRLLEMPAVASAEISVGLPDTVAVKLSERVAIILWQVGTRRFLVDERGALFGELGADAATSAATLPVIADDRAASGSLAVGSTLDPVILDAATRLASLTPAQVGSAASALAVSVTDDHGFILRSVPDSWTAVFGLYLSVRTPDLIPGQVQALHALFTRFGEANVGIAVLADEANGTYTPKATPKPTASPKPTATP